MRRTNRSVKEQYPTFERSKKERITKNDSPRKDNFWTDNSKQESMIVRTREKRNEKREEGSQWSQYKERYRQQYDG